MFIKLVKEKCKEKGLDYELLMRILNYTDNQQKLFEESDSNVLTIDLIKIAIAIDEKPENLMGVQNDTVKQYGATLIKNTVSLSEDEISELINAREKLMVSSRINE